MKSKAEKKSSPETLLLTVSDPNRFPCSELFSRGVRFRVKAGTGIRDFLCRRLGVAESYIDDRIQTVFLNGRAVDDVSKSRVEAGDVLSLSAAMPGLVGATFRRGGHLAAFRKSISYVTPAGKESERTDPVTLKLFNLVARELGPYLLQIGVFVSGRDLAGPLKAAEKDVKTLERNGAPVSMAELSDLIDSDREVLLRVEAPR